MLFCIAQSQKGNQQWDYFSTLHFYCWKGTVLLNAVLHSSYRRVINNENNAYPKMSDKRPLSSIWSILFLHPIIATFWYHFHVDVISCIGFWNSSDSSISTRKQNMGELILQIPSSLCTTSHDEVTNKEKKDSHIFRFMFLS
jgi:hypothetical protein